jgi:hypothetical protein
MSRSHNAVLLCRVPDTFKPNRPHDLPAAIVGAQLYARNLSGTDAAGFCHTYNKAQLAAGLADRKWALRVTANRVCWRDLPGEGNGHARPADAEAAGEGARAEAVLRHASPDVTAAHYAAGRDVDNPGAIDHAEAVALPVLRHVSPDVTARHYQAHVGAPAEPFNLQPSTLNPAELFRVFAACELMNEPRIEGIAPADWWKALLLVLTETGLRLAEVLTLETAAVDWAGGSSLMATHHLQPGEPPVRFSRNAMRTLERIKGDRRFLFPCPGGEVQLRRASLAAIAAADVLRAQAGRADA